MTHLILQSKSDFEHEVIPQTDSVHDSNINHALIATAQEVAELLKQSYPVQADRIDNVELIAGENFAEGSTTE